MKPDTTQRAGVLVAVLVTVCGCRERDATPSGASTSATSTAAATIPAPSRLPPAMAAAHRGASSSPRTESGVPSRVVPGQAPAPTAASPTTTSESPATAAAASGGAATTAAPAPPPPPPGPSALALALGHLPFKDGERLEYQVKYGFLGVGSATLQVLGLDTVRGTPTVHAQFTVQGGIKVYRVNDRYESWFDPRSFTTLRTIQHIDEGSYDRDRDFEMYPERQMMSENGKPDTATVAEPLDEASFLFFLRTIPLEVGQTYQFNRYFKPDRNPVTVVVERKEQVKVPAGTFSTIVVRPIIKTSGIFGEGGRAEVWFADDSTRTLVQLKSKLKFGSLNLYLRNRQIGSPWVGAAAGTPTP